MCYLTLCWDEPIIKVLLGKEKKTKKKDLYSRFHPQNFTEFALHRHKFSLKSGLAKHIQMILCFLNMKGNIGSVV